MTIDPLDPVELARERKEAVPARFRDWLRQAESIVDESYPLSDTNVRTALISQLAGSMMLLHKLGEIELSLDDIRLALENPSWS